MARLAGQPVDAAWTVCLRIRVLPTGSADAELLRQDHPWAVLGFGSVADLRRCLPALHALGRARRLVLVVLRTDRPEHLGTSVSGTAELLSRCEVTVEKGGDGGVVAQVRARRTAPVHDLVRSLLRPPGTAGTGPSSAGLRVGVTSDGGLPWAAGDPRAVLVDEGALDAAAGDIPPADVLAGRSVAASRVPLVDTTGALVPGDPRRTWQWAVTARAEELRWRTSARLLAPVDGRSVSPLGFRVQADDTVARVVRRPSLGEDCSAVVDERGGLVTGLDPVRGITENDIAAVRRFRHVEVHASGTAGPLHLATVLANLMVAGVPVLVRDLPVDVRGVLGRRTSADLDALTPATTSDILQRESWSVTARRHAVQQFTTRARWAGEAAHLGLPAAPAPAVSVLLASRRAHMLPAILGQLEAQTWQELEVVLALHGVPADEPTVQAAVGGFHRRLRVVEVPADRVFGEALNAGLAACSGTLVTKVDDDDWYGPHHVTDLVLAHLYSGAMVVGCKDYFAYLGRADRTVRRAPVGGAHFTRRLAGGTVLMATADLRALGGWSPVPRAVDRRLFQAVTAAGGLMHSTHGLGFCLRRAGDHTWGAEDEHFLRSATHQWAGLRLPPQITSGGHGASGPEPPPASPY